VTLSSRGKQKSSTRPRPSNPIEKLCLRVGLHEYRL